MSLRNRRQKHRGRKLVLPEQFEPRIMLTITLTNSGQEIGNSSAWDISLSDFNGDGHLDAWIVTDRGNEVWANDGEGRFTQINESFGSGTGFVSIADLDADGDSDAVVTAAAGGSHVWINNGAGQFTDTGQGFGTSGPAELADLDGDGDVDVLVGGPTNTIFLNDGQGQFASSGQFGEYTNGGRTTFKLMDLDGDHDIDVFLTYSDLSEPEIWLNAGDAVFQSAPTPPPSFPYDVISLDDLDSDGDVDAIVLAGFLDESLAVLTNDGNGKFTFQGEIQLEISEEEIPGHIRDVALGDLDADGDLDAMLATSVNFFCECGNVANRVLINDGLGEFTDLGQTYGHSSSSAIALGDLDGDDDVDAFVGNRNTPFSDPALLVFDTVWLNTTHDRLIGDASLDDEVAFEDFLILSANFGKETDAIWQDGDFNEDGSVDFADFLLLSANFGDRRPSRVAT